MQWYWAIVRSPGFQLAAAVLIGTAMIESLVALWAVASRRHWFARALAIWCASAGLVPIRAYEPALIFAGSAAALALIFAAARWLSARRQKSTEQAPYAETTPRFRFDLRGLFLLMALIGLWLAVLVPVVRLSSPIQWLPIAASIAVTSSLAAAAYWTATGARKLRSLLVLAMLVGARELPVIGAPAPRTWEIVNTYFGSFMLSDRHDYALIATILAAYAIGLSLIITLSRTSLAAISTWRRRVSRGVLAFLAFAIGLLLV